MGGRRTSPERRGKGRPTSSGSGVGRDSLIAAARALLQELPPAQVTSTAIARRAGADPALVRYYFGNRENLLFEVAKLIGAEANRPPPDEGDPVELLADMIHNTFRFTRSAKHMQRLMIEELEAELTKPLAAKARAPSRGAKRETVPQGDVFGIAGEKASGKKSRTNEKIKKDPKRKNEESENPPPTEDQLEKKDPNQPE